jgi:hypothetical protein
MVNAASTFSTRLAPIYLFPHTQNHRAGILTTNQVFSLFVTTHQADGRIKINK